MQTRNFCAYADAVRPLSQHRSCGRCGYSLFTLSPGGRCPECGLEVWRSLRPDLLDECPTHWRRSVAWGARLIALALAPLPLLVWPAATENAPLEHAMRPAMPLALPLLGVMFAAGVLLLLRADETHGRQRPGPLLRSPLRGCALLMLVGTLGLAACELRAVAPASASPLRSISVTFIASLAPGLMLVCGYIQALARRLPHLSLARAARILKWCSAVATGLIPLLLWSSTQALPARLTPQVSLALALALGFYHFMLLCLLWKFADRCADVGMEQ